MNTRHHSPSPDAQRGLTLIELMISMVLGLLLMLGVVNVYLSQVQSYRVNDNLGQLQNSARTAFELMARELREAGGNPCGAQVVENTTGATTGDWRYWNDGAIIGYDGADALADVEFGDEAGERVEGTDAIMIRSGTLEPSFFFTYDLISRTYTFLASPDFSTSDVLLACDYVRSVIFTPISTTPTTVEHAPPPGTPYPDGKSDGNLTGGFIQKLSNTVWYVGYNSSGGKSLFRIKYPYDPDDDEPAEIARGVTEMQIGYLTRNELGDLAKCYVDDTDEECDESAITNWDDPDREIVALRIDLNIESTEAVGTGNDGVTPEVLDLNMLHVVSLRHREIIK